MVLPARVVTKTAERRRDTPDEPCGYPPAGPVIAYGGKIGQPSGFPVGPGLHTELPANPFLNACEASDDNRHVNSRVIPSLKNSTRGFFYIDQKFFHSFGALSLFILQQEHVVRQGKGHKGKKLLFA